nr:MAG TPA: hypothetical protein [Caudoviricetes sp.]
MDFRHTSSYQDVHLHTRRVPSFAVHRIAMNRDAMKS